MVRNILEYVDASAKTYPRKPAFVGEAEALSFQELRIASRRIGSALLAGASEGKFELQAGPVPILMEKGPSEVAAFLGVVSAGRSYCPMDPDMPERRVRTICETLEATLAIVDRKNGGKLADAGFEGTVLYAEDLVECAEDSEALRGVRRRATDCDLLYVIFTSGSTGAPKGVAVSHRAVIDFVEWFGKTASLGPDSVFGNQAPFYFDMSVKDIYSTLRNGATTYLIPKKLFNFPARLLSYIDEHGINTLAWAVSAVCLAASDVAFERCTPHAVRAVCFGGEALPVGVLDVWRRHLPDALYMNMYGPTEAAVDCAYHIVGANEHPERSIPIGKPCENTDVFIVKDGRLARPGETGELYVRGTALACGYYNDPQRTAQAFVQNPLQSRYPEVVYRTGDMGYVDDSGDIVFASREDGQIKHMGYRIELGEIESAVGLVSGVGRCCCLFDAEADKIVCAYVGSATRRDIILGVKAVIPKYMWPNRFVQLDEMPLTANGKIDRRRLEGEHLRG